MYYAYLKLPFYMHSYFMTEESQNLTRIHAVIRLGELMFECGLCQFCTLFWEDEVENTKHQLTTFRLPMGAVLDVPMLHCWSHPNVLASFLGSTQLSILMYHNPNVSEIELWTLLPCEPCLKGVPLCRVFTTIYRPKGACNCART